MATIYRHNPNRTSWGPVTHTTIELPRKIYERSLSGNYDRLFNKLERDNSFECIKNVFEGNCTDKEDRYRGTTDRIVNRRSSTFDRADISLATKQTINNDEIIAEYYQERILYSQARQLYPLQEDLADWINKTIDISYLNGENFIDVLDNGVELCQLAAVIYDRAIVAKKSGIYKGPTPLIKGRCWQRAARRSFFSRDNMENFINFCRELGVHDNLLFESDDLVLHAQPRQVILCLLEVARLVSKFIEPPGLVQFEKEIALEEHDSGLDSGLSGTLGWQFRESSPENDPEPKDTKSDIDISSFRVESEGSVKTDDSGEESIGEPVKPLNELDKRVQIMTRLMQRDCNCTTGKCSKLVKVKKVGEGKYNIAGRNVFIRLLKGRHMMVRVGGGWDTLDHFLSRHDPCQVRLIHAPTSAQLQAYTLPISRSTSSIEPEENDTKLESSATSTASSVDEREPPNSPTRSKNSSRASSGKTSPRFGSNNSVRSLSTPNAKSVKGLKKSMTLTLNTTNEPKTTCKLNTSQPSTKQRKSITSFSTPNTPTAAKPRTPMNEMRKPFSNSTALNKKNRSMSLTSTTSLNVGMSRSTSGKGISQEDIERSIRKSLPLINDSSTKPFLYIKAKYRSPPPREVPPR